MKPGGDPVLVLRLAVALRTTAALCQDERCGHSYYIKQICSTTLPRYHRPFEPMAYVVPMDTGPWQFRLLHYWDKYPTIISTRAMPKVEGLFFFCKPDRYIKSSILNMAHVFRLILQFSIGDEFVFHPQFPLFSPNSSYWTLRSL